MYTIVPVRLLFEHTSSLNSLTRCTYSIPEIIDNADSGEMVYARENLNSVLDSAFQKSTILSKISKKNSTTVKMQTCVIIYGSYM
jgi:hypothetical protein